MSELNMDRITSLPGYSSKLPSKTYGGYIQLGDNKHQYYMFIESEKNHNTAPLLFWTNGGPGCSGLMGLFEELGPYRPQKNGSLKYNPFTWTKFANIVFVEQPIGVGFSWSTKKKDYKSSDKDSAKDNLTFVLNFLEKYPKFNKNDLYLSSESYGGHYIPLWANEIIKYNKKAIDELNFKGIILGNPYVDYLSGSAAQVETYWGYQMIPKKTWNRFTKHKCNKLEGRKNWRKTWKKNNCTKLSYEIEDIVGKHNPYAIDYPICVTEQQNNLITFYKKGNKTLKKKYTPCIDNFTKKYLNRKDVKTALHAHRMRVNWKPCSNIEHYTYKDTYATQVPLINKILNDDRLKHMKILIMSGTADAICGTVGTQNWLTQLDIKETKKWKQYFVNKEPAGYISKYNGDGKKKLIFATVSKSGHEIPLYKPQVAFNLIKNFISNKL